MSEICPYTWMARASSTPRPISASRLREITRGFDSVMFCLSKGLGAPVGSMLVGGRDFIRQARSVRKALGGGMRQAGVLAAAGLIALEQGPTRLQEDHACARLLAEGLAEIPGIEIDLATVQTNIVIFDVSGTGKSSTEITEALKSPGGACRYGQSAVDPLRYPPECFRRRLQAGTRGLRTVCNSRVSV